MSIQIDDMAIAIFEAYGSDIRSGKNSVVELWSHLSSFEKGNWRRAAMGAYRHIEQSERKKAECDRMVFGSSFMIDGVRVDPSRVKVVK